MPIYRCNKCGFICEDSQTPVHTQAPCGRCGTPAMVYGTVFFVEEIVKRLATASRELQQLKTSASASPGPVTPAMSPASAIGSSEDVIKRWFSTRKIEVHLDASLSDTSGFFDDTAVKIGQDYGLFAELIERVRFAYRKSHTNVVLELGQLSQKDGQAITQLCRWLYEHTFFSRFHYQKVEKIARITLQSAPAIRQFFEGSWLEWYALMSAQEVAQTSNKPLQASARGAKVSFPNEDLHELDVICLSADNQPICIECKSGEFRRDIEKYSRLRKRLDIPRQRFIVLSPELTQEQAEGLSSMYELSFVNLSTLKSHLAGLL